MITGQPVAPLDSAHGAESARAVAVIDEDWCIGCTLCIKACPTDAIIGSNKWMHTVIEPYCTGCALCVPVCPVDCIALDNVTGEASGWDAWSDALATQARQRYEQAQWRRRMEHRQSEPALSDETADEANSPVQDDPAGGLRTAADRKRVTIARAQASARAQRQS